MLRRYSILCAFLITSFGLLASVGCTSKTPGTADDPDDPNAPVVPAPEGAATVKGFVKYDGEAPKRRPLQMSLAVCSAQHTEAVLDESLIVNANGTLKNVVVYVEKAPGRYPVPEEPVAITQKGCVFIPHVVIARTGQDVIVRNDDDFLHNVHGYGSRNGEFNETQTKQGEQNIFKFRRQEVAIKIVCDVHGWMSTYVAVVRHPFVALTGEDGSFEIAGLPPGKYKLMAWHESYSEPQMLRIEVADKDVKEVEFKFEEL